jgi:hypothetical protein
LGVPKKFVIDPHHIVQTETRPPRADPDDHRVNGEIWRVFSTRGCAASFHALWLSTLRGN